MDVLQHLAAAGHVPERIVHNDTKLNNVLLDDGTGEGLCVLDLDTVMPGLALHDFGDMVRSGAATAAEDEPDTSRVAISVPVFEALARGFLEGTGGTLNEVERRHMVVAAKVIAFELGLRFLTDYLEGDRYFRARRAHHNLDRCRAQFALVRDIASKEPLLEDIVRRLPTR